MQRNIEATILGQNTSISVRIDIEYPKPTHHPVDKNDIWRFKETLAKQVRFIFNLPYDRKFEINGVTYRNVNGMVHVSLKNDADIPHISVNAYKTDNYTDSMTESAKKQMSAALLPFLLPYAQDFEALKDSEWTEMLASLERKATQYEKDAAELRQLTISNATR